MGSDLQAAIASFWQGEVAYGPSLAEFTTLRVGGPAEALIRPHSQAELTSLIQGLNKREISWRVIGRGSNILVADRGWAGVTIVLGEKLARIERLPFSAAAAGAPHLVRVEAGCTLARLVKWCADQELSGLEFAAGIPGTLGGAVRMNAGAWGGEIGRQVEAVTMVAARGEIYTLSRAEMRFAYRSWSGNRQDVVMAVTLALQSGSRAAIRERCRELTGLRRAKQPQGVASAGSFFRNPPGHAAGQLIEQAGLKGAQAGGAEVSRKHANFLINRGRATAADFLTLMTAVQQAVRVQTGLELEPEVELVGEWDGSLGRRSDEG